MPRPAGGVDEPRLLEAELGERRLERWLENVPPHSDDLPAVEIGLLGPTGAQRIDTLVRDIVERSAASGDIAQSASFLIDAEGRVVWLRVADNYRVRPEPETFLRALE